MQRRTSFIAPRRGTEAVYERRGGFKVLVAEAAELLASLHLSGCKRKHFKWLFVLFSHLGDLTRCPVHISPDAFQNHIKVLKLRR